MNKHSRSDKDFLNSHGIDVVFRKSDKWMDPEREQTSSQNASNRTSYVKLHEAASKTVEKGEDHFGFAMKVS